MFRNAQVGDPVWCLTRGWGKVYKNRKIDYNYRIFVKFNDYGTSSFTHDGREKATHKNPTLFWKEFKIPECARTPPVRKAWHWVYEEQGVMHVTVKKYPTKEIAEANVIGIIVCKVRGGE